MMIASSDVTVWNDTHCRGRQANSANPVPGLPHAAPSCAPSVVQVAGDGARLTPRPPTRGWCMPHVADEIGDQRLRRTCPALYLLGGFRLHLASGPVTLPPAEQRLFALVALRGPITRQAASSTLWTGVPRARAAGNLRSLVWRLAPQAAPLLEVDRGRLALTSEITTDAAQLIEAANVLSDWASGGEIPHHVQERVRRHEELLPDWFDDWVLLERERLSRLRLRALERMATALVSQARYGEAVEAGLEAVRCEPLSEAAHRCVLSVHVAEGNVVEAQRHLAWATTLIREELGVGPTAAIVPDGWQD